MKKNLLTTSITTSITTPITTPKQDGFYMPGEHQAQDEIWLGWPQRTDTWPWGAKPAQAAFVQVAHSIAQFTPVTVAVSAAQFENARALLNPKVRVVEMSTDDAWFRDTGPTYVINKKGERRAVDWQFNAWGGLVDGLYFPWDKDDQVAAKIAEYYRDKCYRAPLVLEGGAIHSDGEGTVFTTKECLLHPSRNPTLSQQQIESYLLDYLGAEKVIWLEKGLYADDDTNGHVDNLLHVARPGEVILSWTDDESDPQYAISKSAYEVLSKEKDAKGRRLKIYKLVTPSPLYLTKKEVTGIDRVEETQRFENQRMAASYANFLITNKGVIFPLLDSSKDGIAEQTLQEIFPEHQIVGVPAREILIGGGNIHCITQQIPSVLRG